MLNRGGPISNLVGGTIGLAKEYKADSRERKSAAQAQHQARTPQQQQQQSPAPPAYQASPHHETDSSGHAYESDSSDDYNFVLDLDEAQQQVSATVRTPEDISQGSQSFDTESALHSFLQQYPLTGHENFGLSTFVLLPQRRPKSQSKGFVRAYAPQLEYCGVSEAAWLDFLSNFEKSISKNSVFHVLNAGVFVASNAAAVTAGISVAVHMASIAIHVSVEAARRGYVNYAQNKFLDVMNRDYFMPRNLYCMIVKYEPTSDDVVQGVDLDNNVCKSIGSRQVQSKWKTLFNGSSMKLEGDSDMPEPAPLVFPELDAAVSAQGNTSSNAWKNFSRVMNDYKDRRATAKFEAEHPNNSKMPSAPRKEFASVYGDPNSEASKGGFISMISKGTETSLGPRGGLGDRISERRVARQTRRKEKKSKKPMSKMLKADALYLMVTNLPSQEELQRVAAQAQRDGE